MLYKEFQEASFGKITQVGLKSLLCVFLSEKFLYTTEYNNYLPFLINKGEIDVLFNDLIKLDNIILPFSLVIGVSNIIFFDWSIILGHTGQTGQVIFIAHVGHSTCSFDL